VSNEYSSAAYLPPRFLEEITFHLIRNFHVSRTHAPLILAIEGMPGSGKTRQCDLALEYLGVESLSIYGYELESQSAGRPAERIRDCYLEASQRIDLESGALCTLVIHDVDTAIGLWGNGFKKNAIFQYTVNNQIIHVTLMSLADSPEKVENLPCNRVPIIMTGNDFSLLHGPLVREGRAKIFRWEPTVDEKIEIVKRLLDGTRIRQEEIISFVQDESDRSIAYFAQRIDELFNRPLLEEMAKTDPRDVLYRIARGGETSVVSEETFTAGFRKLRDAATERRLRGGK